MTQTTKQWATTGFIFGIASAFAATLIVFFLTQSPAVASPQNATTISGTIDLAPAVVSKVHLPAIVFVIARDEVKKGHPVLAKRLDVRKFPTSFSLGPQDVMMGQAPPLRVSLEARIDLDGDAATQEPGTPSASINSVTMGASDVRLQLH